MSNKNFNYVGEIKYNKEKDLYSIFCYDIDGDVEFSITNIRGLYVLEGDSGEVEFKHINGTAMIPGKYIIYTLYYKLEKTFNKISPSDEIRNVALPSNKGDKFSLYELINN